METFCASALYITFFVHCIVYY